MHLKVVGRACPFAAGRMRVARFFAEANLNYDRYYQESLPLNFRLIR